MCHVSKLFIEIFCKQLKICKIREFKYPQKFSAIHIVQTKKGGLHPENYLETCAAKLEGVHYPLQLGKMKLHCNLAKSSAQTMAERLLASFPGSLLKNGGRREPGNIHGSCRLPPPCSGGTNQIAERNHVYT